MLTAKITTEIVAQQSSALDLTAPQADISKSYVERYSNGGGADQAQLIFSDSRSINASSNDDLDLSGVLASALGGTIAFAAIKEIIIKAKSTNTGDLRVGKVISNGFAGPFDQTAGSLGVRVPPNGILHLRNPSAGGWAVTNATGDLLRVENLVAAQADYDVFLIGE
jgi:hypothetical protein